MLCANTHPQSASFVIYNLFSGSKLYVFSILTGTNQSQQTPLQLKSVKESYPVCLHTQNTLK